MSCIPCSKVSTTEQGVIKYYKTLFDTKGIEYYVYRLSYKKGLNFVEKALFNNIFETDIRPDLPNGAEYFSIKEFKS